MHSPPINRQILIPFGYDDDSINNRSQQILRAGPSHSDHHHQQQQSQQHQYHHRRINMGMQMSDRRHTMGAASIDRISVSYFNWR
jgi:hypothetical protein